MHLTNFGLPASSIALLVLLERDIEDSIESLNDSRKTSLSAMVGSSTQARTVVLRVKCWAQPETSDALYIAFREELDAIVIDWWLGHTLGRRHFAENDLDGARLYIRNLIDLSWLNTGDRQSTLERFNRDPD